MSSSALPAIFLTTSRLAETNDQVTLHCVWEQFWPLLDLCKSVRPARNCNYHSHLVIRVATFLKPRDCPGVSSLTESRIDCLSCVLGQDAPDDDYQLPDDARFCRHFLPEYWQSKGFDREWGDAAVMNWPQLEILVRRDIGDSDEGARFIILAPYSARRPIEIYTSDPYAHGSY